MRRFLNISFLLCAILIPCLSHADTLINSSSRLSNSYTRTIPPYDLEEEYTVTDTYESDWYQWPDDATIAAQASVTCNTTSFDVYDYKSTRDIITLTYYTNGVFRTSWNYYTTAWGQSGSRLNRTVRGTKDCSIPDPDPDPDPTPAPSASITATPASGAAPLTSLIKWSTSDATSATITGPSGFSYSTLNNSTGVSQTFATAGTYTYSISASGPGGSDSSSCTVTVTASSIPADITQKYALTVNADTGGTASGTVTNSNVTTFATPAAANAALSANTSLTTTGTINNGSFTYTNTSSNILFFQEVEYGGSAADFKIDTLGWDWFYKTMYSGGLPQARTVYPGGSISGTRERSYEDTIPPHWEVKNTQVSLVAMSPAIIYNLTATPSSGYTFQNWTTSGPGSIGSSTSATTTYTMGLGNATVTAHFIASAPSTNTTFTANGPFIYDGAPKTVTITANPPGATFTTGGATTRTTPGIYTATATANGSYSGTKNDLTWEIKAAAAGSVTATSAPAAHYESWFKESLPASKSVNINP